MQWGICFTLEKDTFNSLLRETRYTNTLINRQENPYTTKCRVIHRMVSTELRENAMRGLRGLVSHETVEQRLGRTVYICYERLAGNRFHWFQRHAVMLWQNHCTDCYPQINDRTVVYTIWFSHPRIMLHMRPVACWLQERWDNDGAVLASWTFCTRNVRITRGAD